MKKNQVTTNTLASAIPRPAVLRLSPTAWAKLLYLRDAGDTEIGGFGISAVDDLLLIEDIALIAQSSTWAHVAFEDEAVADFFDAQVLTGRRPEEFARIWVHTHPGNSADPSGTDEITFARVFGSSDWAVMFILARGGQTYARLRYNVGPGADIKLAVEVDFGRAFAASDRDRWQAEYLAHVRVPPLTPPKIPATVQRSFRGNSEPLVEDSWHEAWDEYVDFDRDPQENEYGFIRDF